MLYFYLFHVAYLNYSEKEIRSYQKSLGWEYKNGVYQRKDAFLNSDAKNSPEEDFAVNIEFFLFENKKVKDQLPKAYDWIQKKYSKEFKLKEVSYDK